MLSWISDKCALADDICVFWRIFSFGVGFKIYCAANGAWAGFEIAFSDTVNILGFDPIEVIYKGQVLGYRLKIRYTNPMEN